MAVTPKFTVNFGSRPTGLEEVTTKLNLLIKELIPDAVTEGLIKGAMIIREAAMKKTPVVTGNLRAGCYVASHRGIDTRTPTFKNPPYRIGVIEQRTEEHRAVTSAASMYSKGKGKSNETIVVIVGYSAAYALKVHENPRAGNTLGVDPSERYQYKAGKTTKGKPSKKMVYAIRGEYKFLENAVKENYPTIVQVINEETMRVLSLRKERVGKGI